MNPGPSLILQYASPCLLRRPQRHHPVTLLQCNCQVCICQWLCTIFWLFFSSPSINLMESCKICSFALQRICIWVKI